MADQLPISLFIDAGYTVTEIPKIVEIRDTAMAFIAEGKTVMSWGSAGSSASKQMVGNPADILQACGYALRHLDPTNYGYNQTRTRVNFRSQTLPDEFA